MVYPRLSACIEWLYADVAASYGDRIRAAATDGLEAVEFWFWRNKEIAEIETALRETHVSLVAMLSEPICNITDVGTHAEFLAGVEDSSWVANRLGCPNLIVVSGDRADGRSDGEQQEAVIVALQRAGEIAARRGVALLLEPLNTIEAPDHFLVSTLLGIEILRSVDRENVRLLYDVFHSATMREDVVDAVSATNGFLGHIHASDLPGRVQPGAGALPWHPILSAVAATGFTGHLGLEYQPTSDTTSSLADVRREFDRPTV